jgi:hypothetical protein
MRQGHIGLLRQAHRQIEHLPLRFGNRRAIERLRPGENMKTAPFRARRDDLAGQSGHLVGVDAEGLGAAAHLHAAAAQVEIGVHADGEARGLAQLFGDGERPAGFIRGFKVERHALHDRRLQLDIALARPGKADQRGIEPGLTRHAQLAAAGDVETIDQRAHQAQQRREGLAFTA